MRIKKVSQTWMASLQRLGEKNKILTTLHYKSLYNKNRSESGVENVQAAANNGVRTIPMPPLFQ